MKAVALLFLLTAGTAEVTEGIRRLGDEINELEPADEIMEPADEIMEPGDEINELEPADEIMEPGDEIMEPGDEIDELEPEKTVCEKCAEYECLDKGACLLIKTEGFTCEIDPAYFTEAAVCEKDFGYFCEACEKYESEEDEGEEDESEVPEIDEMTVCEMCSENDCLGKGACLLIDTEGFSCEIDPDYFTEEGVCENDFGHFCEPCEEYESEDEGEEDELEAPEIDEKFVCGMCAANECFGKGACLLSESGQGMCEIDPDYFTEAGVCENDDGLFCEPCEEYESEEDEIEVPEIEEKTVCEECAENECLGKGACLLIDPLGFTCEIDPDYHTEAAVCEKDFGYFCEACEKYEDESEVLEIDGPSEEDESEVPEVDGPSEEDESEVPEIDGPSEEEESEVSEIDGDLEADRRRFRWTHWLRKLRPTRVQNGEQYCESGRLSKAQCQASSCCHWNTWERGPASNYGRGRCWSSIQRRICTDLK